MAQERRPQIGVIDWILVTICLAGAGGLAASRLLVVPAFVNMFQDFGSELPTFTRLVVSGGFFPAVFSLVAILVALGLALRKSSNPIHGRLSLLLGALIALAANGVTLLGLYWPIFEMAGNVSS